MERNLLNFLISILLLFSILTMVFIVNFATRGDENVKIQGKNSATDMIKLEAKSIKSGVFYSEQEKVKRYLFYCFFIFSFILIMLIYLRRL